MQLGYVILYVEQVGRAADFYTTAFGFERSYTAESGDYVQLETGSTALGLVSRTHIGRTFPVGAPDPHRPSNEIGVVTDDVPAAIAAAARAGATVLSEPHQVPWGQTIAYVTDPDGFVVELCTPVGGTTAAP